MCSELQIAYTSRADGVMTAAGIGILMKPYLGEKSLIIPLLDHGVICRQFHQVPQERPHCDSCLADTPTLALGILVADCLPIVLYDPVHGAFSLVHGGWRSLSGGIVEKTLEMMQDAFGTKPHDLHTWIGPSLRKCCNRVEIDNPLHTLPGWQKFLENVDGRCHVDLQGHVIQTLRTAGVPTHQIEDNGRCTFHEKEWFSYRRDKGKAHHGRMAVVIWRNHP